MKRTLVILSCLLVFCCKEKPASPEIAQPTEKKIDTTKTETSFDEAVLNLSAEEANRLAGIQLQCLKTDFPYKLETVLNSENDLKMPTEIHPAFTGCGSWESSLQAQWTLLNLLAKFPEMDRAQEIEALLKTNFTKENIQKEMDFSKSRVETQVGDPFNWAWILKLTSQIHDLGIPFAAELEENIKPLAELIEQKLTAYYGTLQFPVRGGREANTAFILNLAWDYAKTYENNEFQKFLNKTASDFYLEDDACPMDWEPGGMDFISPCLSEIHLMAKVLSKPAFDLWIAEFTPQLKDSGFSLETMNNSGFRNKAQPWFQTLNYTRAGTFYFLGNTFPEYQHLKGLGDQHLGKSMENLFDEKPTGKSILMLLYALDEREKA